MSKTRDILTWSTCRDILCLTSTHFTVVTGFFPSSPRYITFIFIAHRVLAFPLFSFLSSLVFINVANSRFALSARDFLHKKKPLRARAHRRIQTRTINFRRDEIHLLIYQAVVVVLTLPRIIKSVVTGQAPVTLELRNTPGKNTNKPNAVHA